MFSSYLMLWLEMVCRWMECDTDRKGGPLKEHINIPDCVQREWKGVRPGSVHVRTVRENMQIVCVHTRKPNVCVCECWWTRRCYSSHIDFLTLGYSLRDGHKHTCRRNMDHLVNSLHRCFKLRKPNSNNMFVSDLAASKTRDWAEF